jgi:exodeoxyribonuclease V beta subunit
MGAPTVTRAFHPAGELPGDGITVIEASAGTGKTYTLTSLILRFVADGVPLSSLLAVTFTRMATGELRDRIRTRLVEAHRRLAELLVETAPSSAGAFADDQVLSVLAAGGDDQVALRCTRLADALADFDSATIATTHGFCQLVLHGLGTAGDALPGTTLLEDPADLIEEVIDDLYLRRSLLHPAVDPPFSLAQARRAALEATRHPDAHLVPAPGDDPCGLLRRLAEAARRDIGRRLLEETCLTYDHLLYRLAQTLEDPDRGPEACRRLGQRYQVVLVDEFQDTDPVQWTVLRRAFTGGATKLVLIGDPKQAVYGFRGADVHAYLEAAQAAGSVRTLDTNWRADQPLLDATAALFDPLQFGHPDIVFRTVRAPSDRQAGGIRGGDSPAPMRWRMVDDRQKGVSVTTRGLLSKPPLVEWVAGDVAADVARLLGSGTELLEDASWRSVVERDIAVLTRTNAQALAVRDALRAVGVASVVAGLESVFRSDGAEAWLRLLEALQEPSSRSRAAAVALGPFMGMSRAQVATAGDPTWEAVHDRLHRWAAVLAGLGVAALYRSITVEERLPGRLLAGPGGERMLTDLGHVAQLLHAEAAAGQLGGPSLRNWLAARIRSVGDEQAEAEDRSRRLDSDGEAVQVLTVHGAKGLEFGVVYCPYMWDPGPPERGSPPVVFHDPEAGQRRTLDVGGPVPSGPMKASYTRNAALARSERRAEDLRLLYVALTRARHRLVIWWARTQECRHSPLGRLLAGRDERTGEVREARGGEPSGRLVRAALEAVAARAPGLVEIEAAGPVAADRDSRGPAGRPERPLNLSSATFTRSLDLRWRRASYSSITEAAHDRPAGAGVGREPERAGVTDEPDADEDLALPVGSVLPPGGAGRSEADDSPTSPLGGLPGGPIVGTFVHRVLERADFAAADLPRELTATMAACARRDGAPVDLATLASGLHAALTTPLGPLLPGTSLADVTRADRLDELSFELPVAGGEHPTGAVRTADIARLLAAHLPPGDRLETYPTRLMDPLLDTTLRGYLTGSLDLVFRRRVGPGPDRWFLADYKTNRLGGPSGDLPVSAYEAAALDAEMQRRHYPLQALIYTVALHRYLRWRLRDYRPETHLGGVLYLFVRGMAGPGRPARDGAPFGVWSWAVPAGLVSDLSDLFDSGGHRSAGAER